MQRNEHKRHKHGHLPGDYGKQTKIAMKEDGILPTMSFEVFSRKTAIRCARSFCRDMVVRSKAQQRQRDRQRVVEGLNEAIEGEGNDTETHTLSAPSGTAGGRTKRF